MGFHDNDWDELLKSEWHKPYYKELCRFLSEEREKYDVYPDEADVFNALKYTAFRDVKAVILGQDPYHNPGQAHGLSFSVKRGTPVPPSLRNIFKELYADCGASISQDGELTSWAKNGVLLLNTVLTVRRGKPLSHCNRGWEILTDKIISLLNEREQPIVFILWGNNAQKKVSLINGERHLVLQGSHPSPLSANKGNFFGGKYFSRANDFLRENGIKEIDWNI